MSEDLLASLAREEEELRFAAFDVDTAWTLGAGIRERAAQSKLPIAIGVTLFGSTVFFCSMPGAYPDNAEWVRRKSAVVMRFYHSSLYMNTMCEMKGTPLFQRYALDPKDYAASGGGLPITVKGVGCIGAVAVSGLTQFEDHQLAAAVLREILTKA